VYNKRENKDEDKGKRCKGEAKGKQVKELNDEGYKRCLGGKGN
jgi:hypothetical protein